MQGDGKIKLDDIKCVLPALCFSAENFGLGSGAGLSGHAVLVKIALWCSYMNLPPIQLCSKVGTAGLGILHQRQVAALLRIVAKGTFLCHTMVFCSRSPQRKPRDNIIYIMQVIATIINWFSSWLAAVSCRLGEMVRTKLCNYT